jgi:DNA-binding MarR family transcriptional regulator
MPAVSQGARKARTVEEAIPWLLQTVGRFRRRVRGVGPPTLASGMTEAQVELLRLIARHPGIRVGEAAAELGLADNTVSTLVSQLSRRRLLVRTADPADRRVGRLRLAAAAQRRSDRVRQQRQELLALALTRLSPTTFAQLLRGVEALGALTRALEEVERPSPDPGGDA